MDAAALKIDIQPRIDAGDTDAQILTWLKDSVTVQQDIDPIELWQWMEEYNGWEKLSVASTDVGRTPAERNAAGLMLKLLDYESVPLSRDDVRAAMDTLGGPGGQVFNAAQKNALIGKSDGTMPRWQSFGYRPQGDPDWLYWIAQARAL